MFIRVQRTYKSLFVIAALLAASLACLGTNSAVIVHPLVGEPEEAVYCQAVLEAIAEARETIDVLLSSVSTSDNPILPALAEAAERGIEIRALLDASNWAPEITAKNRPALTYFHDHGIEARFDDPATTLHAKLVIVDRTTAILGSSNWNRYALTEHKQADVLICETTIGEFYSDYFDTLWGETLSGRNVELLVPDDFGDEPTVLPLADLPESASYVSVLLQLLGQAERSIHVAMYRMSYYSGYGDSLANDLLHALTDAAHRGLDVKVLLDDCAYYEDSAAANLTSAIVLHQRGVEVRLDDPGLTTHAKLVVIDGETVLLGSTNWNYYSLEKNCETGVVFVTLPEIAAPFEAYFQTLWTSGRELAP